MTWVTLKPDEARTRRRRAAEHYRPDKIDVLFLCESPPAYRSRSESSYFYFANNPSGDILFATIVLAVLCQEYRKAGGSKPDLLLVLKRKGYWLIDAVEYPINKTTNGAAASDALRKEHIYQQKDKLLSKLRQLRDAGIMHDRTNVVLIKKLVFDTLAPSIRRCFQVPQEGPIPFPGYYGDEKTVRDIRAAMGCR